MSIYISNYINNNIYNKSMFICRRDPHQAARPWKQVFLTATRRSFSHIIEQKRHANTLTNRHLFSGISLAVPPHQEEECCPEQGHFSRSQHPEEPDNRIMEKRIFPGVRKKRPIKRNEKKLLNKVLDYLTSDSYLFAPLVSRPPSGFSSSVKKRASLRGLLFSLFLFGCSLVSVGGFSIVDTLQMVNFRSGSKDTR